MLLDGGIYYICLYTVAFTLDYDVVTDVEVISPSGHVLLVGVFAVCRYSNNISLGVGSFENC